MMIYSQVEWRMRAPSCGCCPHDDPDHPSNVAAFAAEREANAILVLAGLRYKHAYSWPDGSLYHYVAWDSEKQDLQEIIKCTMARIKLDVIYDFKLIPADEDEDPHKADCKTLKEYMDRY